MKTLCHESKFMKTNQNNLATFKHGQQLFLYIFYFVLRSHLNLQWPEISGEGEAQFVMFNVLQIHAVFVLITVF